MLSTVLCTGFPQAFALELQLQAHVALGVFRFQNFVGATLGASIIPNTLVGVPSYIYSILAPKTLFLAVE